MRSDQDIHWHRCRELAHRARLRSPSDPHREARSVATVPGAALISGVTTRPTTKTPPAELWDAKRLASYLKVPKTFVYRLTSERHVRYHRAGKELRFDPADVAAWLDAGALEPAPLRPLRTHRSPR